MKEANDIFNSWIQNLMPSWMFSTFLALENWQWLTLILAFFTSLGIRRTAKQSLRLIGYTTKLNQRSWFSEIKLALEKPFGIALSSGFWLLFLQFFPLPQGLQSPLATLAQVLFSISLVWTAFCATEFVNQYFLSLSKNTPSTIDDHLVPILGKVLKAFVLILGSLTTIQGLGFNVMSVLAGLGLGGLAFALAAKDTCANLFGSIMILLDRPFSIGDWIVVDKIEGTVEEIGFRSTRLRTFNDSIVSIPNANLANSNIDNMGLREYRKIKVNLGVVYSTPPDKIETFIEAIRQIILQNPKTKKDEVYTGFNSYGDFSLNILVRFFLKAKSWHEELSEKQDFHLKILRLAKELDVEFAYPTQTLYLPEQSLQSANKK